MLSGYTCVQYKYVTFYEHLTLNRCTITGDKNLEKKKLRRLTEVKNSRVDK